MLDAEPGRPERRPERVPPGAITLSLLGYVLVIAQSGNHGSLTGAGTMNPECLRISSSSATSAGLGYEPRSVAGQVRPLGQRMDREQASCEPPLTELMQDGHRRESGSQPSSR